MQARVFDGIARELHQTTSRRRVVRLIGGIATLGLAAGIGHADGLEAKGKKKHKKHKKHKKPQTTAAPSVVTAPTSGAPVPPVGPTCSDGIKNGSETGVDCGGPQCPPCDIDRTCRVNTDCRTARCGDGLGAGNTCQSCTSDGVCGRDANGGCLCDADTGICVTGREPTRFENSCDACRSGQVCREYLEGFACVAPCGG